MRSYRWAIVVLVVLMQSRAMAQSAGREEASERFSRAVELYQDGAYQAALLEFQRAYDAEPDYHLLYNIGRTRIDLHDYLGAAQAYERYLREGGSSIPEARRTEVEQNLAELRARVGQVSIRANRDGADVFIDDIQSGKTPMTLPIQVNVGRHRVEVRASDGATDTQVVDVAASETATVAFVLTLPQVAQGPAGMPPLRKAAIYTAGAGGVLLIGSLVTGMLAIKTNKQLGDDLEAGPDVPESSRDKVKTLGTVTDVLLLTGAVSAVAGGVMWLVDRHHAQDAAPEERAKLSVDVGFGSLALRGRF